MPRVMPQSERLIVVVASAPHIGFRLSGFSMQAKLSTLSVTGLVTPSIVKSPTTSTTRSPSKRTLLERKVSVGELATLK